MADLKAGGSSQGPAATDGKPASQIPNPKSLLEQVDAAYQAVFDSPMPGKWQRKIERAGERDAAWLAKVDEKTIRAALAMCKGHPLRIFGLGWVQKAVEARAVKVKSDIRNLPAAAGPKSQIDRQTEQYRRDQQAAQQRLAAFHELPQDQQSQWLQTAKEKFPMFRNPERLEAQAAYMASTQASVEVKA